MNTQGTSTERESGIMTGLFTDKESTESAYQALRDRGYSEDEINVMMSDETRNKYYGDGEADTELLATSAVLSTDVFSSTRSRSLPAR